MKIINYFFIFLFFYSISSNSQNEVSTIVKDAPNLFIKCWQCDMTRMKRSINYVNYVIQRQDAQIVAIVTSQGTGNGYKYSIYLEGQNFANNRKDTLTFNALDTDSESEIDDKIIEKIKKGLLPYILESPLKSKVTYSVGIEKQKELEKEIDPWKSWVFTTRMRGNFSGSSSNSRLSINGSLSASKITKKDKWNFRVSSRFSERNYYFRDTATNEVIDSLTITSERKSKYFSGNYIYSLNKHWSIGAFGSAFSNTFSNFNISSSLNLAVEYNFFDFEKSDRKSLVLSYRVGGQYNDYVDTTIYNKTSENLLHQSISLDLYQKQKWGNISLGASFSNYMHDIRINDLSFNTNVDWNIFKGLNLSIGAYVSFVNDQISLPKKYANVIDTVLGDRLLSTDYSAYTYIGLSYTFGSKYANSVNPRFNSGGGTTYYFF